MEMIYSLLNSVFLMIKLVSWILANWLRMVSTDLRLRYNHLSLEANDSL